VVRRRPGHFYRTDQFKGAGITSTPDHVVRAGQRRAEAAQKFPSTYGLGAPSDDTNAIVSFIWARVAR